MTTSREMQEKPFLSDVLEGEVIPLEKLAYFRARLSHRIHDLVLSEFDRLEDTDQITKAALARRIGRRPEQLTRWLNTAGNWTLDTLSDILLGMGCELHLSLTKLAAAHASTVERPPQLASVGSEKETLAPQTRRSELGRLSRGATGDEPERRLALV